MNEQELRKFVESRGYKVKSIRCFRNSFHIAYQTSELKFVAYYRVSLSDIPSLNDGSQIWLEFSRDFQKVWAMTTQIRVWNSKKCRYDVTVIEDGKIVGQWTEPDDY